MKFKAHDGVAYEISYLSSIISDISWVCLMVK